MYWNNSRYYRLSLLRHCGHFMWSPTNFFNVYSHYNRHLARTYFSVHNMKVSGFLIYTMTYFTVFIYQQKYFEVSVRHHFCQQNWQTEKYSKLFHYFLASFTLLSSVLMFFAASMFLPYLHFRVASAVLDIVDILSCLAPKEFLATSLPIISSSSLVRYRCLPYNL